MLLRSNVGNVHFCVFAPLVHICQNFTRSTCKQPGSCLRTSRRPCSVPIFCTHTFPKCQIVLGGGQVYTHSERNRKVNMRNNNATRCWKKSRIETFSFPEPIIFDDARKHIWTFARVVKTRVFSNQSPALERQISAKAIYCYSRHRYWQIVVAVTNRRLANGDLRGIYSHSEANCNDLNLRRSAHGDTVSLK